MSKLVDQNPTPGFNWLRSPFASQRFILLMLVLIAAVPTLLLWNKAAYTTGDSYMFMRAGLNVVRGRGFTGMDGGFMYVQDRPLYPLAIGLLSYATSHVETVARIISLFGATFAVVAFYWLVKRRHSPAIAICSALMFALVPLRVWSGQWILNDGLALGLVLSSLAVLFSTESPGRAHAFFAGILVGLAYLTRSETVVVFLGGSAYLLIFAKAPNLKLRLLATSLLVIGFVSVVLPHQLWLYQHLGTFAGHRLADNLSASEFLYQGYPVPFDLHFDESTQTFVRVVPDLSWRAIARRYAFFGRQELGRVVYLLGPWILTLPLLLVGGARFLLALAKRETDALWQAILVSPLLVLPFFHIEDRYLLAVLPVLCLWIVCGTLALGKLISKGLGKMQRRVFVNPGWALAVLVVLLVGIYANRLTTLLPRAQPALLPQQVATWMQTAQLPEGKIMAQEPALAFYAGSIQVWLPYGPFDHLLQYAHQHQVRYIFVSSNDAANPLKNRLLQDGEPPRDLFLIQSFRSGDARAKLFELRTETGESAIARK